MTTTHSQKSQEQASRKWLGIIGLVLILVPGIALWRWSMNADPAIKVPTPELPSPNAFDFYQKAGKLHSTLRKSNPQADAVDPVTDRIDIQNLSPQQLTKRYPTAAKQKWLAQNAEVLSLLRQGFNYRYQEPPVRSIRNYMSVPYSKLRSLARLLVVESHVHAEHGDWMGASRSALDILRMGHDIPRGGDPTASLVGYAIDDVGRAEINKLLPRLDARTMRAAARQLETLESTRFTEAEALTEKKWSSLAIMLEVLRSPTIRRDLYAMAYSDNRIQRWKQKIASLFQSKHRIVNSYTTYMDAVIKQASLPYQSTRTMPVPAVDPLGRLFLPGSKSFLWISVRDRINNTLLSTMLALHAFHLETGHYPESLQQLTPHYLKRVPLDPCGNDAPLRYRKVGKNYLLYSIGPDGFDDGGRAVMTPQRATSNPRRIVQEESKGDFVAGINE